ncbi:carbonic anhydrase family protein [Haloferula sp.]|uniref:carbonic anhydrase family protein n=1 Tax=Haloferula sp. TaxID=2497595 RepID=UPI003C7182BA
MKHPLNGILASAFLLSGSLYAADLPPTAEEQKALTPKAVLDQLMAGNARYAEGKLANPNIEKRLKATSTGQFPKAYILSCVDSRVPVEMVFDQGIGDVFVGRVAGNIESVEQLGSVEFATKAAGAKLVMVLGHEACGAVKGACDHVKMGNLTALLAEIEPAVNAVEGFEEDQENSKNPEFVAAVIEKNVRMTVADLRKRSEVLSELEKNGDIMIVGGVYDLDDGKVTLLDIAE